MRRVALAFCCILVGCGSGTPVVEQQTDAPYLEVFTSSCVRDFDDLEQTKARATSLNWKPVTDSSILKRSVLDDSYVSLGWSFVERGQFLVLALSEGNVKGDPIKTCAVMGDVPSVSSTKRTLATMLKATKRSNESEAGTTSEIWTYESGGVVRYLSFATVEARSRNFLKATASTIMWNESK